MSKDPSSPGRTGFRRLALTGREESGDAGGAAAWGLPPGAAIAGGMMFGLGLPELLIIFLIVLPLFGASRLPQMGSGLGKAIKNFKESVTGKDAIDVTPKKGPGDQDKP